jgi:uncharacterized protein (UPF0276 family)
MTAGVGLGRTGIGLRAQHVAEIVASRPPLAWLEAHAENYMGGGAHVAALERLRHDYPISLHGVGLSLGTADGLDPRHLIRLRALVSRIDPFLVSEHLSWSTSGGAYINHLLPLPCTEESLEVFARHVHETQHALGRQLLIENPSSYLRFRYSPIPEPDFLAELVRRTGCALLCDVNNIFVSACNLGFDTGAYLEALPADAVKEIHLAGHARNEADGLTILIDDHGSPVADAVWDLYTHALRRLGSAPTLIEWDTDVPALDVLADEARHADRLREMVRRERANAVVA